MAKPKIGGLGKGLQALIPTMAEEGGDISDAGTALSVPLALISANPYQPRRAFDEEKLRELAASIMEHGVVQPILVKKLEDGYQLVAGERRLRAAKLAGLREIPVVVREMTEQDMMEISLIENIQRQDLDPVEEARAYSRLSKEFALTQEQIAKRVAKSRPYIANSIRLLQLPDAVLRHLAAGTLTIGHVRPLLAVSKKEAIGLAERFIAEGATARDAEKWVKERTEPERPARQGGHQEKAGDAPESDSGSAREGAQESARESAQEGAQESRQRKHLPAALAEIQRILREVVKTKVEISHGDRGGKILIEYYTDDDLERILEVLTGSVEIEG